MLLSVRDLDILRFLRWCRCICPDDLKTVFSENEILNLMGANLIKLHSKSASLLLTGKGYQLLNEECGSAVPNVAPSYRETDIARHTRTAKLGLTAYRAGVDIFTMGPEALTSGPALFLASLTRGRGRNPWGNSRIAAIGHIGDLLCCFYNPNAGKISLADELRAFSANTTGVEGNSVMVFAGASSHEILAELDAIATDTGDRLMSYGEAYRRVLMPVHLLSLDETGAMQLQIMSGQDYRNRLTRAALRSQYRPPMPGLDCDATFDGLPFIMAADMDLRRIDLALEAARSLGYQKIAMAALDKQVDAVLNVRYQDTDKARIFILTQSALTEFFGHPPALFSPPDAAYHTKKGDVLYAPLIQTHRRLVPDSRKK